MQVGKLRTPEESSPSRSPYGLKEFMNFYNYNDFSIEANIQKVTGNQIQMIFDLDRDETKPSTIDTLSLSLS